jgi:hypothetical protein
LRAIAEAEPGLFREVLALGRERYETDRRSYHVSGSLASVPEPEGLRDADLPGLLGQFAVRQALHVTYGSALDRFGDRLRRSIERHEDAYYTLLEEHFERHLAPFVG